jgi:tRNA (guanine-N7-)-methyltransferase
VAFRNARAWEGFGRLEIEIGCGNGHFLAEYASRNPGTRLIGVDIKEKRCLKAEEKARKRGLSNVVIVRAGAEGFLRDIPGASVDAYHLYFLDPGPKSRHRKRRFFTAETLSLIHGTLKPGGRIFFSTDFFDYYVQAKILLLAHGGFSLVLEQAPEEAFLSVFSRKYEAARKPVRLITAVKL